VSGVKRDRGSNDEIKRVRVHSLEEEGAALRRVYKPSLSEFAFCIKCTWTHSRCQT
jgi:hypothetical protein